MNDAEYLKQSMVRDLVTYLMEDEGMGIEEALSVISESQTMAKLLDDATGLYRESPAYAYEFLREERLT